MSIEQLAAWSQVIASVAVAESFFIHHRLGLIPKSHWEAYCRFWDGYAATPGVADTWAQMKPSFEPEFAEWLDGRIASPPKPAAA
jgi:hypothetical protein